MDKQTQIKEGTDETTPHLPMGQLFYLLYSNGFRVKPDDYIEMLKITERFGSHNIDETASWLCPIIATSETEQLKFYNIIEQYKKLEAAQQVKAHDVKETFSRRTKILVAMVLAVLLLLVVYLSIPQKVVDPVEPHTVRTVEKGVPSFFDAGNLLPGNPADTTSIQFNWQFEDGSKKQGVRVVHTFTRPGNYTVKRQFSSAKYALAKKSDSLLVHVCDDLPKLNINAPTATITAQQPATITASAEADPGTVSYYQWSINDSVFTTPAPIVQGVVFSKKGDYSITCKAVVGDVNSPCSVTDNKVIHVEDNGTRYTAGFSATRPGSYEGKTTLKWWVTLVFLLPAAVALLYSVFKRKPLQVVAQQIIDAPVALNKGPFDIPFEQNDLKLIQQERDLRRTLIQMRYKAEEETLVLSVASTINSIIRSGGSPQLVFAPLTQQQQYLILIDRANPKSMLVRLFAYLAKTVADDGIPVTVFYYDKNFVAYNDAWPGGLSLQRLAETYSLATLIVLGKAHELVYSAYPLIEEKYLHELNRWQSKAIITPTPVKDWSTKEKVLQQYLILLPADTMSLQKLIPALREKIKPQTHLLELTDTEQYTVRNTDFRDTNEIREYFGKDETMFQWLCAICIYPRLKWEVVIEIGKAILDKYGEPEKLNYTSLLKLCRISWMQQGVFPQATRLELLKLLTVDNELCARERLLQMLNYSTSIYGEEGYFFEEEKKRQQLTNQFILHANNHQQYNQYAGSRESFKKLWKKDGILDMPLKKYLEKDGGEGWQTPVNNGDQPVSLSMYFDKQEKAQKKITRIKKVLAAALAVLLVGCWAYIAFGGGAKKLQPLIAVSQYNHLQTVPVTIKVIKDFGGCGDSAKNSFDKLDGYVQIDNDRFPVLYDQQTAAVSFDLSYESLTPGKASLLLSWDSNKTVIAPLIFTNRLLPDSVTVACVARDEALPVRLNIRYNDTAGYRDMEITLLDALANYKIDALQADFTDSSRIVYYEPNQKPRADSIVAIIKQSLYIDIKEEFISEIRTPPAVPILFINTLPISSMPVNESNAQNKASAEEYHLMADEAFQKKQYLEAIQSYKRAVAMNPKDALAFYQMGISYEMMGAAYSEQAIEVYNAAIGVNALDGLYWYRRGSVKYGLKRYAGAIQDFNKVISLNSDDTQKQYGYTIYFRGKSYYFLKNLSNACIDFKRSADLGVKAGKQDYETYCNGSSTTVKINCDKTFGSLKEAMSTDASLVCKLDLSTETFTTIPKQIYAFKNLTQLNLGSNAVDQTDIDRLQKALPACKIIYSAPKKQTEKEFGYIELDEGGYTNAAGQQVMETVSGLLKAQPQGKIRLTAYYASSDEQKKIASYMNTIVNMFAKIGVNTKTQIEQQVTQNPDMKQPQQNETKQAGKTVSIRVTGINVSERLNKSTY